MNGITQPSLLLSLCILFQRCSAEQAIFLGSTGLVGGLVLDEMLRSPTWKRIHLLVRKPSGRAEHSKVNEIVLTDLHTMSQDERLVKLAEDNEVTAAVITLGVNELFGWTVRQLLEVEVTLTDLFVTYCHEKLDVKYVSLLSMAGAARGKPFSDEELTKKLTVWNVFALAPRIKGAVEETVSNSGVPYRAFFRPSNFETDEYRFGWADAAFQTLFRWMNWALPYEHRSVHVKDLARAMFRHLEKAVKEINSGSVVDREVSLTYLDFWESDSKGGEL